MRHRDAARASHSGLGKCKGWGGLVTADHRGGRLRRSSGPPGPKWHLCPSAWLSPVLRALGEARGRLRLRWRGFATVGPFA
jgi:hypothetical protein